MKRNRIFRFIKFYTSNVIDMRYMFCNCFKLKYLNINNFIIRDDCLLENIFFHLSFNKCKILIIDEK